MKLVAIAVLSLMFSGCSVFQAISQPPAVDTSSLKIGLERHEVLSTLGSPIKTTDIASEKEDTFHFESGMHQAWKLRAIPYLAADIFTIGLAELILFPLELTALNEAECEAIISYDQKLKVKSLTMTKKGNSSQKC